MSKIVLGLHIAEHSSQALLLESDRGRWTLHAALEWQSELFKQVGDDTPGVDDFVERLSAFLAQQHLEVHEAAVALDTARLFVNIIPADDPTENVIEEQIAWELSEYFPGSPKHAFISDYHILPKANSSHYSNVLTVSVRRDVVHKIQRALGRLKLSLVGVDGDHFAAETVLRTNYPDTKTRLVALAGVKAERLDMSILHNWDVESYSYKLVTQDENIVQELALFTQAHTDVEYLMVFGKSLDEELIGELRAALPVPVEVLNPFRTVTVATKLRLNNDLTTRAFRYAAAVGIALRQK
jgi:Tfp pilus assembly PilM family ATPase